MSDWETVEPGIRRHRKTGRYHAYVRVKPHPLKFKRFKKGSSLQVVRRWRSDTRHALELTRARPAAGTLASDIPDYLRGLADRPSLQRDRAQQLAWWVHRFGHRSRASLTTHELRVALVDLRTSGNELQRCACGRQRPTRIVRRGGVVEAVTQCHACRKAARAGMPLPEQCETPQGLSAASCDHYRLALLHLYSTLDGEQAPNPVREVPMFRKRERLQPRAVSYDLIRLIVDAMSDQGSAPKGKDRRDGSLAKARIRVIAFTGMRHSELKRMKPSYWDPVNATLYIDTGKDGQQRTIALDDEGMSAMKEFARLEAWGPFSNSTLGRAFRRALKTLDLTDITPRDLRHSYGTMMYRVTGDLRIVAEMLGHRQQHTTQRYTLGYVPEYMRLAAARFADAIRSSGEPAPLPPATDRQLRVITGGR